MGSLAGSFDLKLNKEIFPPERSIRQCDCLAREVSEALSFKVFKSALNKTLG